MPHKHRLSPERGINISTETVSDLCIALEDVEQWRLTLKSLGFTGLQIEKILEKSVHKHNLADRNFLAISEMLEGRRGKKFTKDELECLRKLLP